MSSKAKFIKGGAVLGLSQVAAQLCSLGRNIIIARLVGPEDFGVAAIFVMVASFLEMISNLSLDRLLVQAEDGDSKEFQKVGQFLLALRGVVIFLIICSFAAFIAKIFSIPEATSAFVALAFVPLLNGFRHLDPKRKERTMHFWPGASVELASQLIPLIVAWPIGTLFGDYRSMLALLIIKSLVLTVGTHVIAQRKYGWSKESVLVQRFVSFGWPLLINGLLLFAIMQGDRFIMGSAKKLFNSSYDMTDVGMYSAALMLTMIPAIMGSRVVNTLFLPTLSRSQHSELKFLKRCRFLGDLLFFSGTIFVGTMFFWGDSLLVTFFGKQYYSGALLISCLSIQWAIKLVRALPSAICMAKGKTTLLMHSNIVRLFALVGVVYVVVNGVDIVWVAIVGAFGECIAYVWSLVLIRRNFGIPVTLNVVALFLSLVSLMILFNVAYC